MERRKMSSRRARRLIFALAIAPLLAGALAGCGRKGPLELPPDVQAVHDARAAQQEAADAAKAKAQHGDQKPKLSEEGASKPKPKAVEGDVGRRPPADYPFFLDPLL
jgi:predicted small lipoprotein YifL